MGGFHLTGPNYTFKNTGFNYCNCIGLHKNINQEEEAFLLRNYPKEIPLQFLKKSRK